MIALGLALLLSAQGVNWGKTCEAASEAGQQDAFLLCAYEGKTCLRQEQAMGGLDPMAPPGPDLDAPPSLFGATERAVFVTCGGLGCIDDPNKEDSPIPRKMVGRGKVFFYFRDQPSYVE